MRVLTWLFRGFLFFTLFTFALNNDQPAVVNWFFGYRWQAQMVIIVLAAVLAGSAVTFMLMLPGWWRQRRAAPAVRAGTGTSVADDARGVALSRPAPLARRAAGVSVALPATEPALDHPPREGL